VLVDLLGIPFHHQPDRLYAQVLDSLGGAIGLSRHGSAAELAAGSDARPPRS
jgi:hypothetical protein